MDFKPTRAGGRWTGLILLGLLVAAHLGLLLLIRRQGPGPEAAVMLLGLVLLVPIAGRLAYLVWCGYSLRYGLSRDGITITCGLDTRIVPMAAITHVLNGRPYAGRFRGWRWPGHEVGRASVAAGHGAVRHTLVYATTPPSGQLLVVTSDLAYAISPSDRAAFVDEFKMRRRLGPVQSLREETVHPRWASSTLRHDQLALQLFALSVALAALASYWLMWHYPQLPAQLVLQAVPPDVTPLDPALLRSRELVWGLPLIGLGITAVNLLLASLVHRQARLAALLLASGTVLFHLAVWLVLARLV